MSSPVPPGLPPPVGGGSRRAGLGAVKTVQTAAFLAIAASLPSFRYAGLARRSDRRAALGDRPAFPRLQELLDMTAGNLSTHLRKLGDAGYVRVTRGTGGGCRRVGGLDGQGSARL